MFGLQDELLAEWRARGTTGADATAGGAE